MVESPKSPTTEELLARIDELERQTAQMRAEFDDLGRAFLKEINDRAAAAKDDCQFAHDYVWPLIHRVFPGYVDTMKRVDGILQRRPADEEKKT